MRRPRALDAEERRRDNSGTIKMEGSSALKEKVRMKAKRCVAVSKFINDYLAVNPKPPASK